MEGLSLSLCIRDIIRDKIDPESVTRIACSCRPNTDNSSNFCPDSWASILESYERNYWYDFQEEARELAWKYLNEGKIDFPRLRGEAMPFIAHGHWVK
jgi:hypothetical protein